MNVFFIERPAMNTLKMSYCSQCEDLVEYDIKKELVREEYKGEKIQYYFNVARCKNCGQEVSAGNNYVYDKSEAKINAYKKKRGIIMLDEISEILDKYDVGKETLAEIAGFGKATVKRYYEGVIPAVAYSEMLYKLLNDEKAFYAAVKKNREKIKDVKYKRIQQRHDILVKLSNSKVDQIVNYIIVNVEEVTPLALQKLVAFSNGVNYAVNGNQLIDMTCEAWQHGPVYYPIYSKYKKYGYKPITDGIKSTHGCMLSKVSKDELTAIDLVLKTFALFSPKTLERISHSQTPWLEKRIGCKENEPGYEAMSEESIKEYYTSHNLNSEKNINKYIYSLLK